MRILFVSIGLLLVWPALAQPVKHTFSDTRILNSHSNETLKKGILEFRVAHRFGDIAGDNGGWETFYGIEEASDIRIGFEYGITDRLMVAAGRTKGAGDAKRLMEGFLKYQLLQQEPGKMPVSLTLLGNTVLSTMQASNDSTAVASFPAFKHRFSYMLQGIVSRKMGDRFSLAVLPTYLHRNFVTFDDENSSFFLGVGAKATLKEGFSVLVDYFQPLAGAQVSDTTYAAPLAVGMEYETGGGHLFTVFMSNNAGILENDFLPYSDRRWSDGAFRVGFRIIRKFVL